MGIIREEAKKELEVFIADMEEKNGFAKSTDKALEERNRLENEKELRDEIAVSLKM